MSIGRLSDYNTKALATVQPQISVVTAVRDGDKTLKRTIDSVRAQQSPNLEYIIADGGSKDGTLEIIRANSDIINHCKSEPDFGISDGFNKGIALSSGKYIALLNADDWLSPGQIAYGIESLELTGADFVFGDLVYHDSAGAPLHIIKGDAGYTRRIGHIMPALNHPTIIVRRRAYEEHGLFDLSLRYAMDYELLLRFHRSGCKGIYDPRMVGHMTLAGQSDLHSIVGLAEVRDVSIRYGESALTAWLHFAFRVTKNLVRRLVERLFPRRIAQLLRRYLNPDMADFGA